MTEKIWMICPRQPSSEPYLPGTVFVLGLPAQIPFPSQLACDSFRLSPPPKTKKTQPWALTLPHGLFHNPSIGVCSKLYGFLRWTAWEEWCASEVCSWEPPPSSRTTVRGYCTFW